MTKPMARSVVAPPKEADDEPAEPKTAVSVLRGQRACKETAVRVHKLRPCMEEAVVMDSRNEQAGQDDATSAHGAMIVWP